MAALPRDHTGRPIPWFTHIDDDGTPDFRVIGHRKIPDAVNMGKCWVCGQPLGSFKAFTIGPMCAVNRVSAEPPGHRECAVYSATTCPFLSRPEMVRRERDMADYAPPAGISIERNPGVTLIWVTKKYGMFSDGQGGRLFDIGQPVETIWFRQGRPATRAEVLESIESGMPILEAQAAAEPRQPQAALAQLARQKTRALQRIPAE